MTFQQLINIYDNLHIQNMYHIPVIGPNETHVVSKVP
jgi:hypothetical protein